MLFTSYEFVLVFLPVVLAVVLSSAAWGNRGFAKLALFVSSLVFYAYWSPRYVALLLAILVFNYSVGTWLIHTHARGGRKRTVVLVLGLLANIGTLVYFKYTNFLVDEFNTLFGTGFSVGKIILPLGLSFITFQKIAFLVDAHGGQIEHLSFLDYGLFVSFFPQLIAGPIVHHREVIPQFESDRSLRYSPRAAAIAVTFFVCGAFKKVIIADQLAPHVATIFNNAANGVHHGMFDAWLGAVTFTLQVYFDFSGYSDMAIGLALMFGVRLPYNFNSPLKAASMIEFWSRWHITLTRFLTAYIYNPIVLRATRRRMAQRKKVSIKGVMPPGAFVSLLAVPTLITMFITGVWHGAGTQFIVFGLIHGAYLIINHAWRNFRPKSVSHGHVPLARAVTFIALVVSMPFFRADSAATAWGFVQSMFGAHGLGLHSGLRPSTGMLAFIALVFLASQVLPNTQDLLGDPLENAVSPLAKHAGDARTSVAPAWSWPRVLWQPSVLWAVGLGLSAWYVLLNLAAPSDFLYFQF